jgi:outer membrane lipase/esterase
MTALWTRRLLLSLCCTAMAWLAGCGSSSVESALKPTRIVSIGDTFSDVGRTGTRYTVNDGTVNIWAEQLASKFGLTLTSASSGGSGFAQAHARVMQAVDLTGGQAPSVKAQIDGLLAGTQLGSGDLVLINGGVSDIVAEVLAGAPDMKTKVQQAGRDLGGQVRRLVGAGAKYVVVVGPYNLGQSRWAADVGQRQLLKDMTTAFTDALLVSIVDLSSNVLYVDAALYFNLVTASPGSYGLTDEANPPDLSRTVAPKLACTSVDAGVGIGLGAGQVSSGLCTTATIAAGVDYGKTLFADALYFTPVAHRLFGDYAYTKLIERW